MEEIIFMVGESPEGGYVAKGLGVSIYTQGETIELLKEAVVDAVRCHSMMRKGELFACTLYGKKSLLHETTQRHKWQRFD